MDKFLEIYNLLRLDHEEVNRNKTNTTKVRESVIKNIPAKKSPGPEDMNGEFY